jgi:hypothetical protein
LDLEKEKIMKLKISYFFILLYWLIDCFYRLFEPGKNYWSIKIINGVEYLICPLHSNTIKWNLMYYTNERLILFILFLHLSQIEIKHDINWKIANISKYCMGLLFLYQISKFFFQNHFLEMNFNSIIEIGFVLLLTIILFTHYYGKSI